MQPILDDSYDEMASTFQCVQIQLLNEALKRHGIADAKKRADISGDYLFSIGMFLDQQWFESEGKRLYPVLCFSEKFLGDCDDLSELGDVYLPSEMFSFEEYAVGNNSYFFEEHNETIPDFVSGNVGD